MEGDDLDNLIADSLGGVQSALEGERSKAAASAPPQQEWAKEAVRELQQGGRRSDAQAGQRPPEEFFSDLVKTFQDENFQKAMASALEGQGSATSEPAAATGAAGSEGAETSVAAVQPSGASTAAPAAGGGGASSSSASSGDANVEEFLQNFLSSFNNAVGADGNFEKSLTSMMSSMLSRDLVMKPVQEIAENMEQWLKSQKSLAQSDKSRYECQLRIYKQILHIYRQNEDPLPDSAQQEVQRLFTEVQGLGPPPEDLVRQMGPKDAEEGSESFEDFMKSMGLENNLGSAEQDLLKKLAEDPEELTKVMKDMAEGLPEEACKQQ